MTNPKQENPDPMPLHLHTPQDRDFAPEPEPAPEHDWRPDQAILAAVEHGHELPRPPRRPLQPAFVPREDIDKLHALIANAPRREDFPPFLTAAQRRRRHWWGLGADCCYIVIKAGLYLMACWVIAMGLPLMFLLLLTGGQMDKVLVFLGSLFGAFADATPDRQYAFASQANWVLVALATAVAAWRLPRFLDEVSEGLKTTRKMS